MFKHLETFPKKFAPGNFITYDLPKANLTEPVAEAVFVIGFKTREENVALAQVTGEDFRHFSVALIGGYVTLLWTTKEKKLKRQGLVQDAETESLLITKRKLNNGQHQIVRVRFSTEEIFLTVVNHDLEIGANYSERFIDPNNKNKGSVQDVFGHIKEFTVGNIKDENKMIDAKGTALPTTFTGCMSGAKLVYSPRATSLNRFRKSIEIDIFKLADGGVKQSDPNPKGQFPSANDGMCGPTYPTPGMLSMLLGI